MSSVWYNTLHFSQPPDNTKTANHQMVAATYWPPPWKQAMLTRTLSTTYNTKLSIRHRRPMRETTAKIASKGTFQYRKFRRFLRCRKKFCRNIAKIRPLVDENYRITPAKDQLFATWLLSNGDAKRCVIARDRLNSTKIDFPTLITT